MRKIFQNLSLSIIFFLILFVIMPSQIFAASPNYQSLWDEDAKAYLISSVEELKIFRNSLAEHNYAGETILLTKDIDIKKDDDIGTVTTEWNVQSGSVFEGYFNGQGHKISGFYDSKAGLFNNIGKDGVITKLTLDVDVTVEGINYAPLANIVGGKIQYCGVSGSVVSTVPADSTNGGGISAFVWELNAKIYSSNEYPPYIADCYTNVNITIDNFSTSPSDIKAFFGRTTNIKLKVPYAKNLYAGGTFNYNCPSENKTQAVVWCSGLNSKYVAGGTIMSNLTINGNYKLTTIDGVDVIITDEQAKTKSTYTDAGWDFDKVWNIDTEGYHDKIYLDTNEAPEGVETFIDEIGPYYYDSELKFVNNGYPYIRSDVLEPVFGDIERKMVTVSVTYPDAEIGYYSPATIKPEVTITGIEGVEADQLKDFIDKYKLQVSCDERTQYLVNGTSIGNLSEIKSDVKLTYQTNTEYVFNIDFDNSTVTSGKLSAKPNQYKNVDTLKKAEAFLALGEAEEKEALKSITEDKNVIKDSYCWTVINITRYDKLKEDYEIQGLLDKWFEAEKKSFKTMYAEDRTMTQELTTTWQRELIAITAAGFAPAEIKAYTKGTYGDDDEGFDLVQSVIDGVGKEGAHMHVPFWLIALDSGDYATSSDYQTDVNNRVKMVYKLVNMGVFGAADGIGMDYVGMYTQGLAKYINPKEGTIYYDVAQKVNEMLKADGKDTITQKAEKTAQVKAMKQFQCPLGGWITYGNYNPATTAQAVVMLSCMGIDAFSEELTTEAGYNMLDSFIQAGCNLDENGLPVSIKNNYEMTMNKSFYSSQAVYAIISWYRLLNGQTALYDCTDVVGVPQVEKMISALPTDITLNDEKAIEAVKSAYDALSAGQKKYIDNADILEEAVKKLAELKKPTDPTQPTNPVVLKATTVKATATSYNKVKLTWKKVTGAESYKIYRSTKKNSSYKKVATVTTLTWTDSKLATGTTYYYKVEASAKNAKSATSKVVSAKPILKAATSVKAASASYNKVKVTWKKVTGATGYKVYRATKKSGKYTLVKTVKTNTYTDSKLTTGKTYYYKVKATNKTASSAYSKVVKAKPVLAKTTLSSVKNVKTKKAALTWKKVDGATGYKVYRATKKNGKYTSVKTVKSTKWTNSSLKKNQTYYYKVRAYKTVDGKKVYGAYSSVKQVTIRK